MKLGVWIVRIIYWLQAFAGPLILFGLVALFVYIKTENKIIAFLLVAVGFISGVVFAEYIRRKYGLESYFGRIYGPNDIDDKFKEQE
jgi:hypothetical protein